MRIAILGWGSLIWDRRDLPITGDWQPGGPVLPIEFNRISQNGERPACPSLGAGRFSVEAAIPYLKALAQPARINALEYLPKAPPAVVTPVRIAALRAGLICGE